MKNLKKAKFYIKKNLINSSGNMYLTVQFFIEINNILTASKSIALRKVNESYMDLIKVYEQRLNRRSPAEFYSII